MWVFCCGMRRSGSTLQFQMTARIVEDAGAGKRVEWVKPHRFGKLRKRLSDYGGMKIYKSHVCIDKMAKEFRRNNAKGVYIYRDIRDVFLSTMRKYHMSFDQLWETGFVAEILRQYDKWNAFPNIMTSRYEEVVADLATEVERIADHVGISLERHASEAIAADYSISRQKKRIEEAKQEGRLRTGYVNSKYDPESNLHTNHIHSGAVGGWREVMTAEQITRIESVAGDWLTAHDYELAGEFESV